MRVLLINYEYPPVGAGAATATQAIARSLVAGGNSATVLTASFEGSAGARDEDGVRVVRVPSRRRKRESATIAEMVSFMRASTRVVRRTVQAERIQGVIAFFSFPSGPAAWWAHRATGIPYIVSLRGGDVPGAEAGLRAVHFLLTPIRRRILRTAQRVVANSAGLKVMAENADPIPVGLIPNGVDTRYFSPEAGSPRTDGPFRLLFVGRFQAQKNLAWLLKQLAQFRGGAPNPFILDLVGDGPERASLAAAARDLGLADIVRFHGWEDRSALRARYLTADLVINPSLYEGMPNVLLEAMACGRAVLASRVPGNDAVVVDRVTGWLYPPNDSAEFQNALRAILSSPELPARFGAAARVRAVTAYSWDRCAQSYLDLLASPPPISQDS